MKIVRPNQLLIYFLLLSPAAAITQQLYEIPPQAQSRLSSFENPNGLKGQGGKTNKTAKGNAFELIHPGETKTLLNVNGEGIVQRIWLTIDQDPQKLRSLRLQMYWDGDSKPAVDVPMGDFFCFNLAKPVIFESAFFPVAKEGLSIAIYPCLSKKRQRSY